MFNFFGNKTKKTLSSEDINIQSVPEDFNEIEPLAAFFKNETGITFEKQQSILKSKLISFCNIRQIRSFKGCLEQVKSNPALKQELINYLTTNESYFYRETHQIQDVVSRIKLNKQVVDILCAPSSTGEEIYSIAIALLEAGVPKNRFNIIGIDINSDALKYAEQGIYNQRNINNLSAQILKKYFIKQQEKYYLSNEVKQCVHLKIENIFSSSFKSLGKFDYIFSRNMLIYFDPETKIKARQILESLLNEQKNPIYFGHADLF